MNTKMLQFSIVYCSRFAHNPLKSIDFLRSYRMRETLYHVKRLSSSSSGSLSREICNNRSIRDENGIFKSFFSDVEIPNDYVHQYIWKKADQWWNKTALMCAATGRSYTYKELRKLCGKFATSLRRKNLLPGDTVAVVLPNVPEYAIVVLGASEAGVQLTLINPAYTPHEISKQLQDSEAVAVITTKEKYPTIMDSMKDGNHSIRVPVIIVSDGNDAPLGSINFGDLVANGIEEFDRTGERTGIDAENHVALLPYSSGTTGLPKGVELTHRNLVANMCEVTHPDCDVMSPSIGNFQEIVPLLLPIYHIFGLSICLNVTLSLGSKLICVPQFTSNSLLNVLEKNMVTRFIIVPPIIQLMINDDRFSKKHLMHAKAVNSGAAPLTSEFRTQFRKKLGDSFTLSQGYGLTETSPVISLGRHASEESSGFIAPNTQIRIIGRENDNYGKNLDINESGEIAVRGPQVMKGYFKNTEATADCMDGDWFKTGDLGHMDDKGQLYITGRLKELIKVQGCQVSPTELENVIQGNEKVADAAVIGVPHEKYGEVPKAFVVPKSGHEITEEEIKNFVAQRVAKYKKIEHVVITDRIIKSPAGKILRRELAKM